MATVALAALLTCGAEAWAQPAARRGAQAGSAQTAAQAGSIDDEVLRPAEFAELVDAYAVVQAQKLLGLDEEQYGRFVVKFRGLQAVRRKYAGDRLRAIQQLNRLTRRNAGDEAIETQLKAIDALDATAAAEVRKATAAVEEGLTVRQRARFRVFEDLMERRKFDLLARARTRARTR